MDPQESKMVQAVSNGILSEQAAATEARIRDLPIAPESVEKRDPYAGIDEAATSSNEKARQVFDFNAWENVQRRQESVRQAQALDLTYVDVGQFLKNAEAIDAWVRTGELT